MPLPKDGPTWNAREDPHALVSKDQEEEKLGDNHTDDTSALTTPTEYEHDGATSEASTAQKYNTYSSFYSADQAGNGEKSQLRQLRIAITLVAVVLILGLVDSLSTKYVKRSSLAFAGWTVEKAPASFLLYCFMIDVLIVCCLPYGPLSYLMGAMCTQLYGPTNGFLFGVLMLFTATMAAAVVCFLLARHKFKDTVQRMISRSRRLKILRNIDRLIVDGQGFQMVLLIRLAPIPTGPTQYFLGTTSVSWGPFVGGNAATNFFFALSDIAIGAGAARLSTDNQAYVVAFVLVMLAFCAVMIWIGYAAKKKLEELDHSGRHVRKDSLRMKNLEQLPNEEAGHERA